MHLLILSFCRILFLIWRWKSALCKPPLLEICVVGLAFCHFCNIVLFVNVHCCNIWTCNLFYESCAYILSYAAVAFTFVCHYSCGVSHIPALTCCTPLSHGTKSVAPAPKHNCLCKANCEISLLQYMLFTCQQISRNTSKYKEEI